ncbi:envelope stress response membrane protein PspB [Polymorphobacter sp.]|uniref:envelope stress response membrane protein PspB n=1 Tax=Polymorphobacter sp. TaxID=1909290 RepID=UPI003F6E9C5D
MEMLLIPVLIVAILFIGLPWLVLHYVSRWRSGNSISREDEMLLDDLHDMARRLDQRLETIERIIAADDPGWKDSRLADNAASRRLRNDENKESDR